MLRCLRIGIAGCYRNMHRWIGWLSSGLWENGLSGMVDGGGSGRTYLPLAHFAPLPLRHIFFSIETGLAYRMGGWGIFHQGIPGD